MNEWTRRQKSQKWLTRGQVKAILKQFFRGYARFQRIKWVQFLRENSTATNFSDCLIVCDLHRYVSTATRRTLRGRRWRTECSSAWTARPCTAAWACTWHSCVPLNSIPTGHGNNWGTCNLAGTSMQYVISFHAYTLRKCTFRFWTISIVVVLRVTPFCEQIPIHKSLLIIIPCNVNNIHIKE